MPSPARYARRWRVAWTRADKKTCCEPITSQTALGARVSTQPRLVADSNLYRRIFEPSFGWEKNDKSIQESLAAMQLFELSQPTPAVLALVRAYGQKQIKLKKVTQALQAIENFHFSFTAITSSRSSGGISFMYSAFARDIFKSKSTQAASDTIDALIGKLRDRRPSYQEFLVGFESIIFTNSFTKQKLLVRYILKKMAAYSGYTYSVDWDDLTIEHIYPQERINDEDWPIEIVGQLGNLAFASQELNGKLGQKSFLSKKRILQASAEGFPRFILDQQEWTPDMVTDHTEQLAELAYHKVWSF